MLLPRRPRREPGILLVTLCKYMDPGVGLCYSYAPLSPHRGAKPFVDMMRPKWSQ